MCIDTLVEIDSSITRLVGGMESCRVLALHGYGQSAQLFERRLEDVLAKLRIKTKMGDALQFVYADAPIALPREDGDEVAMRCWYPMTGDDAMLSEDDTARAVSSLRQAIVENAPLVGIFAFSQGASLLSFAGTELTDSGIQFIVCAGGSTQRTCSTAARRLSIPSLHWAGNLDEVVSVESSSRLCSERFEEGIFQVHAHGHIFPSRQAEVDAIAAFISDVIRKAKSEDVQDEVLAVRSIFGEDDDVFGGDDEHEDDRCIRITVRSQEEHLSEMALEVTFDLPPCYPFAQPLVLLRPTHAGIYTASGLRHLEYTAQKVALTNAGSPSTFEIATAVQEEIANVFHANRSGTARADSSQGGEDGSREEEEDDDERDEQMIQDATDAAAECAFRVGPHQTMRKGKCWSFVVGLVGKPSAGKSSFFNAAKYPEEAPARVGAFPCVHDSAPFVTG